MSVLMAEGPRRNDLCPCGSGLKYKHCHLNRSGTFKSDDELANAINAATEAVASQDPAELRRGLNALEHLSGRVDLTPVQRTAVQLNRAAGLQYLHGKWVVLLQQWFLDVAILHDVILHARGSWCRARR